MYEKGQLIDLFVTAVDTSSQLCHIWAQGDFESYSEIEQLLSSSANQNIQSVDPSAIDVGQVYLAKYHLDNNLYRAQVIEVNVPGGTHSNHAKVFFIDFGNTELIDPVDLKKSSPKFFAIPPQATKFILADIQPGNGQKWTEAETTHLSDNLVNQEIKGKILEIGTVGRQPSLRIFETSDLKSSLVDDIIAKNIGKAHDNIYVQDGHLDRVLLNEDQVYPVYVTFAQSAVNFWIQKTGSEPILERLHGDIENDLNNDIGQAHIQPGLLCIAKYTETESYYRAVITNVNFERKVCEVTFVDYGNSDAIAFDEIRNMPGRYYKLPAQAVPCTLSGEAVSTTNFDKIIESENICAKILKVCDSGLHIVALSDEKMQQKPKNIQTGSNMNNMMQEDKKFSKTNIHFEKPSLSSISSENIPTVLSSNNHYMHLQFNLGVEHYIVISHVEDSGYFYCQLLENAEQLDHIMNTMNQPLMKYKLLNPQVKIETPCLVRSSKDNVVYRAEVVSNSKMGVEVKLVDIGDTEFSTANSLYVIESNMFNLPPQAIYCSLAGTDRLPPSKVVDVLKHFESHNILVGKVTLRTGQLYEMEVHEQDSRGSVTDIVNGDLKLHRNLVAPPEVAVGSTEKVFVIAIISDTEFFGQLCKYSPDALDTFQSKLNTYYTSSNVDKVVGVKIGSLCCCKFSLDDQYYRARVIQLPSSSSALVSFIDYGNQEVKSHYDLLKLESQFCDVPQQGINCSLVECYPKVTQAILEKLLLEKEVVVMLRQAKGDDFVAKFPENPDNTSFINEIKRFEENISGGVSLKTESQNKMKTISNEPVASSFKSAVVSTGKLESAIVTHVDDPENFYLQFLENSTKIDDLMGDIDTYCGATSRPDSQKVNVGLGLPVLAQYTTDEAWYRACITGMLNSGKIEVKFVDYGNSELTERSSLRQITSSFMELPSQSVHCAMVGVACSSDQMWSPNETDLFFNRTSAGGIKVRFQSFDKHEEKWYVDLYEGDKNINKEFGQTTGKLTQVPTTKPSIIKTQDSGNAIPTPNGKFGTGLKNNNFVDTENEYPRRTTNEFGSAKDNLRSNRITQDNSFGKSSGTYQRSPPRLQSQVTIKSMDLVINDYLDLYVVYIKNPGTFWCQKQAAADQLAEMMDELNISYDKIGPDEMTLSPIVENAFCCAKYSEDNQWYRAQVKKVKGNMVQVQFIDYGNDEEIPSRQVKQLKQQHATIPVQSFQCSLFGAKTTAGAWSDEATAKFEELAMDKKLVGAITEKSVNGVYVVELIDGETSLIIHQQLVNLGLVVAVEETVIPPPTGPLRRHSGTSTGSSSSKASTASKQSESLKDLALELDESLDLNVVFVETPSLFWCQLTENSGKLKSLMDELDTDSGESLHVLGINPEVDMVCCAKYSEDGCWYRGIVQQIRGKRIRILFVDYGNEDWTTAESIRPIKKKFLTLPRQAFKCSLQGVDCEAGDWPIDCSNSFEDMTMDKNLVGKITTKKSRGLHKIYLIDDSDGAHKIIGEQLILAGKAIRSGSPIVSRNTSYDQTREATTDLPVANLSSKFKIMNIIPGNKYKAVASWILSTGEFFCQLEQSAESIMSMSEKLYHCYHSQKLNDLILKKPAIGQSCVAYYEVDGNWYRGEIADVKNSQAHVFYVDYGNVEIIPLSKVKQIKQEFLELPCQALKCTVDRELPANAEVNEKFKQLLTAPFELTVISEEDGLFKVKLFNASNENIAQKASASSEKVKDIAVATKVESSLSRTSGTTSTIHKTEQKSFISPKLSQPNLNVGDERKVLVSHIDNIHHFYCQTINELENLEEYMEKVQVHYSEMKDGDFSLLNPETGMCCVAKYKEDDMWYRAVIEKIESRECSTVRFIDYGNAETVSHSEMQQLVPQFSTLPLQSLRTNLSGLPRDVPDGLKEYFEKLVEENEEFSSKIVRKSKDTFDVELLTVEGKSVAEILIDKFDLCIADVKDVEAVYKLRDIPTGVQDAYVIHSESPSELYLHLSTLETELADMADALHAEYDALSSETRSLVTMEAGQQCIARYSEDSVWYRAVILEKNDEKVSISMIDYGNRDSIAVTELKEITDNYTSQPVFAFKCSMADTVEPAQGWSKEDCEKVEELTGAGEKVLKARFSGSKDQLSVSLQDGDYDLASAFSTENVPSVAVEVVSSSEATSTTEESGQLQVYSSMCVPDGPAAAAYVSHINSAGDFYVQLNDRTDALDSLTHDLLDGWEKLTEVSHPLVGSACCAVSSDDGAWYRAKVVEVNNAETTVKFVDFGNCDKSSVPVRTLSAELLQIPPFAIQCALSRDNDGNNWSPDSSDELSKLLGENELTVTFITSEEPCQTKIFCEEANVNEKMMELFPTMSDALSTESESKEVNAVSENNNTVKDPVQNVTSEAATYPEMAPIMGRKSVYVSHVENPSVIYLQLVKQEVDLQELMDMIEVTYANLSDEDLCLKNPQAGEACIAKYSADSVWYRARITNLDNEDINVEFVDYGNSEKSSLANLKEITPELLANEPMSIKASLKGVMTKQCDWPESVSDTLIEKTTDKVLNADFIHKQSTFIVELLDKEDNLNNVILDLLPSEFKQDDSTDEDSSLIEGVTTTDESESLLEQHNTDADVKDGQSVKTTPSEIPEKSESTQESNVPPEEITTTEDMPYYPANEFPEGEQIVHISSIESPSAFYVQLASCENELSELLTTMSESYSIDHETVQTENIQINTICAAVYEEDNLWYRGSVTAINNDGTCSVLFVDYGNRVDIVSSEVKVLKPEFQVKPAYAVHCCLYDFDIHTPWTEEDINHFKSITEDQELQATLMLKYNLSFVQLLIDEKKVDKLMRTFMKAARSPQTSPNIVSPANDSKVEDAKQDNIETIENKEEISNSEENNLKQSESENEESDDISSNQVETENIRRSDDSIISEDSFKDTEDGESNGIGTNLEKNDVISSNHVEVETVDETEDLIISDERFKVTNSYTENGESVGIVPNIEKNDALLDDFNIGRRFEVYISHTTSPDVFWCQLASKVPALDRLMEDMTNYYFEAQPSEEDLTAGQLCAVCYSDEKWYRAKIAECSDLDSVQVFFIDYGNYEKVEKSHIYSLREIDQCLLPQGFECSLHNIHSNKSEWSESEIERFVELTFEKKLLAEVKDITQAGEGDKQPHLVLHLLDMGISIAQTLVDEGLASDLSGSLDTSVSTVTDCEISEPNTSPQTKPEPEISESLSDDDQMDEQQFHDASDIVVSDISEGDMLHPEASKLKYKPADVVSNPEKIDVSVSHVDSPDEFWCQGSASTTEIPLLMDKINDFYTVLKEDSLHIECPMIGMPCIAKCVIDNSWYRGQIITIGENVMEVRFVDYGNSEVVERSQVKAIDSSFTELPVQSFKCSLQNIVACGTVGLWDDSSLNRFEELVNDESKLQGVVQKVSHDEEGMVMALVEMWNETGQLSDQLVEGGYAQWAVTDSDDTTLKAYVQGNTVLSEQISTVDTTALDDEEDELLEKDNCESVSQCDLNANSTTGGAKLISTLQEEQIDILTENTVANAIKGVFMELQGYHFPTIKIGETVPVKIIHSASPSDFIVQLLESSTELNLLKKDMTSYCEEASTESNTSRPVDNPTLHNKCLAHNPEDKNWYRALVTDIMDNDNVEVQCVDYGYKVIVPSDSLLTLPDEMTRLPIQALCCSLCDIQTTDWSSKAIDFFNELCSGDDVSMSPALRVDSGRYEVYLYTGKDIDSQAISINHHLVSEGYAAVISDSPLDMINIKDISDGEVLETSFLDVSLQRSSSIGDFGQEDDENEEIVEKVPDANTDSVDNSESDSIVEDEAS